jgi:HAD superfamily hydrolase (TIGR01509 family)
MAVVGLDTLASDWRAALHAASSALAAAADELPEPEVRSRSAHLAAEVPRTEELLAALARSRHAAAPFLHLLDSAGEARRLLGLPPGVRACVFDLEGVLIGSAALHSAAWAETFDELLSNRTERTGGLFAPFSPGIDYPRHVHGRPRLDGVRAFLASRGIRLPEGAPADPPGAETVHGLANRKNEVLLRRIVQEGVGAFEGVRNYLELAHDVGVGCAVVSASANTETILARAGLSDLIEERVDGTAILADGLRAKPEPDTLLAACRLLGVEPRRAAAFETTPVGVAAARAAGFALVVGVDRLGRAAALLDEGADAVVSNLAELLLPAGGDPVGAAASRPRR